MMCASLLRVEGLLVAFRTDAGEVTVLRSVDLSLAPGETLCVVGESGSGKSMTALAIMGLVPSPAGRIRGGTIRFAGEDLISAAPRRLQQVRGREIAMIFQEPMTALNPVFTVGEQVAEALRWHERLGRREAMKRATELLDEVGIPASERRIREYPHQLSGGMRQRVMIALAIACRPKLLIADEPTTALDVTVQAQILDLLKSIQRRFSTAILLITHNIGVVAETADRVIVMYAGRKVEEGRTSDVLIRPAHPYTAALIACAPRPRLEVGHGRALFDEIPGIVPSMQHLPSGCAFAPRCRHVMPRCSVDDPPTFALPGGRSCACWLAAEEPVA